MPHRSTRRILGPTQGVGLTVKVTTVCSETDCGEPTSAKGLCATHYHRRRQRIRRGHDPDIAPKKGKPARNDWERFFDLVEVDPTSGCWIWTGSINKEGYANVFLSRSHLGKIAPHAWAWIWWHGQRPRDEQGRALPLDHLCHTNDTTCQGGSTCRHRRCVNPLHLEPVTTLVNVMRARGFAAANAAKTHCIRGHPFAGDNLRVNRDGSRGCRACARLHASGAT